MYSDWINSSAEREKNQMGVEAVTALAISPEVKGMVQIELFSGLIHITYACSHGFGVST